MRHSRRDALVDEAALFEAVETKLGRQWRIAFGHQLSETPAGARDRLETASAPTTVDEAVF